MVVQYVLLTSIRCIVAHCNGVCLNLKLLLVCLTMAICTRTKAGTDYGWIKSRPLLQSGDGCKVFA